jgi:hypothetical protein
MNDHFSFSQIERFLKCGIQWKRIYMDGDRIPPGIALLKGKAFHLGAELNHRQKMQSHVDLRRNEIIDYSVSEFDKSMRNEDVMLNEDEKSIGLEKVSGEARDSLVSLSDLYVQNAAPTIQPVMVEERITIDVTDEDSGLKVVKPIVCVIDLADDKNRIRELKTSKKSKSQADVDGSLQIDIESIAYKEKTGRMPDGIIMDTFISTKVPQYKPMFTKRTEAIYSRIYKLLFNVQNAIEKEVFMPPPPGSW